MYFKAILLTFKSCIFSALSYILLSFKKSIILVLVNNTKVLSKYLYYATVKIDAGDLVDDRAYPSLKTSVLENVKINLPSIEKQQEIVLELDLLSDIIKSKRQELICT